MSLWTQDDAATTPTYDPALVKLIGEKFISRKDVKAIERPDGAWNPVTDTGKADGERQPFKLADFQAHLAGEQTLGHYMVGQDDTCKLFAFDLDLDKEGYYLDCSAPEDPDEFSKIMEGAITCNPREVWATGAPQAAVDYFTVALRCLAEGLAHKAHKDYGIPVAIYSSGGKGLHVYGFTGSQPAAVVRELALGVVKDAGGGGLFEPTRGDNFWKSTTALGRFQNITIEIFPKQDSLQGKDLGNLMRLALGVNRKTDRRGYFVNCKAGYDKLLEMDPVRALTGDLPWD